MTSLKKRFFPAMQIDVVWFPKEGTGGNKFSKRSSRGLCRR
jgi:ATP-dependent DNA helicase RecG